MSPQHPTIAENIQKHWTSQVAHKNIYWRWCTFYAKVWTITPMPIHYHIWIWPGVCKDLKDAKINKFYSFIMMLSVQMGSPRTQEMGECYKENNKTTMMLYLQIARWNQANSNLKLCLFQVHCGKTFENQKQSAISQVYYDTQDIAWIREPPDRLKCAKKRARRFTWQ